MENPCGYFFDSAGLAAVVVVGLVWAALGFGFGFDFFWDGAFVAATVVDGCGAGSAAGAGSTAAGALTASTLKLPAQELMSFQTPAPFSCSQPQPKNAIRPSAARFKTTAANTRFLLRGGRGGGASGFESLFVSMVDGGRGVTGFGLGAFGLGVGAASGVVCAPGAMTGGC